MTASDPIFRAPKGTPNFNAFRTLALGVVAALAILLLTDPVIRMWDGTLRAVPWITARITVLPAAAPYHMVVSDETTARHPVAGIRRVWIEDPAGNRICNTERHDSWTGVVGTTWTFPAFTDGCPPPAGAFRACSKFLVETPRGVPGVFGPFCSALHRGADHAG